MRFDDTKKPSPTRGVIIADTSSLFSMVIALPDEFLTHDARMSSKKVAFFNALPFLARHGHEVIIPEMVSNEISHVMRDGTTISDYFLRKKPLEVLAEDYLIKIPGFPGNIYIVPPHANDKSAPAEFIRSLWRIHKSKEVRSAKNSMISSLQRGLAGKQYGDIAAYQLINSMKRTDMPVFYLSENEDALNTAVALRADIDVKQLGIFNMWNAMQTEGLLPIIGIAGDVSYEYFRDYTKRAIAAMGQTAFALVNAVNTEPFVQTLTGLHAELESFPRDGRPNVEPSIHPTRTGLDRFKKKWAKRNIKTPEGSS